jgi:hypothetical protein
MALFEVVRIKTGECPSGHEDQHIIEAEISGAARKSERIGVSVLRFLLTSGDNLYTVSPTTKSKADVTKGRCECGWKTIRSVRADVTDNDVTSVPAYL